MRGSRIIPSRMKFVISIFLLVAVLSLVQAATEKLPKDVATALHAPTNIVLYSLEPWEQPTAQDKTLHGVKILGQISLHGKQTKDAITAFETAIAQGEGFAGAHCFDPRHALRVTADGQTYDFMLCYACGWLSVIRNEKEIVRLGAVGSPDQLNELLNAAKIPLSKSR